jgi:hypothetical protein
LLCSRKYDLADAIAFALRYSGGTRVWDADEALATIAASGSSNICTLLVSA